MNAPLVTLNFDRSSIPVLDAWGDGLCQLGHGFICWQLRWRHDRPGRDDELVGGFRGEVGTHHPPLPGKLLGMSRTQMRAAARIGMSKRRERSWPARISVDGMDVGKLWCSGWRKGDSDGPQEILFLVGQEIIVPKNLEQRANELSLIVVTDVVVPHWLSSPIRS
jgi:hypothetical protein